MTCKVKDCDEGVLLLYEEVEQRDGALLDPTKKVVYVCCPVCHEASTPRQKQMALFTYFSERGIEPATMVPVAEVLAEGNVFAAGTFSITKAVEAIEAIRKAADASSVGFRTAAEQAARFAAAGGSAGARSNHAGGVGAVGGAAGGGGAVSSFSGNGHHVVAGGGGGAGGAGGFQSAPNPDRMVAPAGTLRGVPVELETVRHQNGEIEARMVRVEKDGTRTVLAMHALGMVAGPGDVIQVGFDLALYGGPQVRASVGQNDLVVHGYVEFEE